MIFLGEQHAPPNASKDEQHSAGLNQVRLVVRDKLRKLVESMDAIPTHGELDCAMKDIYSEIILFVSFGAIAFYIESPRYNLEYCQKHEAERCRLAKKQALLFS